MHNFNNKTSTDHFEHCQTEPTLNQYEVSSIAEKEDYATQCLIHLSQIDDKPEDMRAFAEWSLLSNIEVAPWPSTQFNRRVDQNCSRSKTSMLLPPCNLREIPTKKQKVVQKRRLTEDKQNYLSIDKLVKDQKIGEKKYSAPVHKTCSAISKYNDGEAESISTKQFGEVCKSKPNIVYILCDEERKIKSLQKPIKKTDTNEYSLAPIVIGKCNLVKKGIKLSTEPADGICKQKIFYTCLPSEGNQNFKGRKKTLQNIRVAQNLLAQQCHTLCQQQKDKQNGQYWKIKKKIEEHIKKQSHLKLQVIEGKKPEAKQAKRYMKYSYCKTKRQRRKESDLETCYQLIHPSTKQLYDRYKQVLNR